MRKRQKCAPKVLNMRVVVDLGTNVLEFWLDFPSGPELVDRWILREVVVRHSLEQADAPHGIIGEGR